MTVVVQDPGHRSRRRRRIILVVGLWAGMFAWSNIPPYRGNILDQKADFFVWHWRLYSTAGHGICDVRYFDMNQGGASIERWTLLGYERPGEMPDALARTEKSQLFDEYERVCQALRAGGDREPNVRVSARCGDKSVWKRVERRKRNVCLIGQRARAARHRHKAKGRRGKK